MKKGIAVSVCVIAVMVLCVVSAGAWTGRMSGMGGPYGLVEDESDFLTHPAVIPQGKELTFYGDLSFFKKDVQKWDVSVNLGNNYAVTREADGDEWNADTRLGFALPLGVGRMGVFFEYSGNFISRGGRYRGNGADYIGSTTASPGIIDVRNENDSIAVRVLYAQPAFNGKAKLGGEFSVGYVTETSSVMTDTLYGTLYVRHNYHWDNSFLNGFAYALPYSSRYWEAKMKASAETMIGASKLSVTPFGGFILDGDNRYDWDFGSTAPWLIGTHEGSVSGYHLGTEAWWRLPVNKSISMPILAKAVYSEKKRDGDGTYLWSGPMYNCDYGSKEKALNIEIGGGIDAQIGRNSRFAGGLYYGYIDSKNDFFFIGYPIGSVDYPSHPKWKEDRITLKLAAETEISPKVSLNGGLSYYYGWAKQDFERVRSDSQYSYNLGFDGHVWGLGLSAGAAFRFSGITFEPYLKGSYEDFKTSGSGLSNNDTSTLYSASGNYRKTQWIVGGGFAVKFD